MSTPSRVITEKEATPNSVSLDTSSYRIRYTVRGIVSDNRANIAIVHVKLHGFYMLPGGGIDAGEDKIEALKRECAEELGCVISIVDSLGVTIEEQPTIAQKQISYGYMATKEHEVTSNLTPGEIEEEYEISWVPLQKALELIKQSQTNDYKGKFVIIRDCYFLEQAAHKYRTGL